MGFVQISKDEKTKIEGKKEVVKYSGNKDDNLLNMLNNADSGYNYKFEKNISSAKEKELLKEVNLVKAIFSTLINVIFKIVISLGFCFCVYYLSGISINLIPSKTFYTTKEFYQQLSFSFIIFGLSLLLISFILSYFINSSIKGVFKRNYLNKINIFLYYLFIILLNLFIYILLAFVYFKFIDSLYYDFKLLLNSGVLAKGCNIDSILWFKYFIVVIVSIFLSINSYFEILNVYKYNKFVFEDI